MARFAATLRSQAGVDIAETARSLLDLGFDGLGLSEPLYHVDWERVGELLPRGSISAVDLFAPLPRGLHPGLPNPFFLGSSHDETKRDALQHGSETIVFANRLEIPYVRVPPMTLDEVSHARWLAVRKDPDGAERTAQLELARDAQAARQLDSYRGTLSKLLDVADRYEVPLAITPGGAMDEAPTAAEALGCLREFDGAPLSLWPDARRVALSRGSGSQEADDGDPLAQRTVGLTLPASAAKDDPGWDALRPLLEAAAFWLVDTAPDTAEAREDGRRLLDWLAHPADAEDRGGLLAP